MITDPHLQALSDKLTDVIGDIIEHMTAMVEAEDGCE